MEDKVKCYFVYGFVFIFVIVTGSWTADVKISIYLRPLRCIIITSTLKNHRKRKERTL